MFHRLRRAAGKILRVLSGSQAAWTPPAIKLHTRHPAPDFTRLDTVQYLARMNGVGFVFHFIEASEEYRFTVDSLAAAEQFHGRDRPFDTAVDAVCAHLSKLLEGGTAQPPTETPYE